MSPFRQVLLAFLIIGLFSVSGVWAGNLFLSADYASFRYSDDVRSSHVEIYYSLLRNQFYFQPDSTGYYASVNLFVKITNDSGTVIDSNSWKAGFHAKSLIEARQPNFLTNDVFTASLIPGSYLLLLRASDAITNITGEVQLKLEVPTFASSKLAISQIQFVYDLAEPDSGLFTKGGKKIIPNTRRVFSHDNSIAYIYAEAYDLDSTQNDLPYSIRIYDGNNTIYKEIPIASQKYIGSSTVILSGFSPAALKSGLYKLLFTIYSSGDSAIAEKYFEVTPGKMEWEVAKEKELLADFPEAISITNTAEAKKFRNDIQYIATRDEMKQYDALTVEGKNNFAKSFWARRDPDATTQTNEFKIEHFNRIKYANEAFSTFRDVKSEPNGWKSDAGRVYIIYGRPSDEENYPSSLTERPWKRWNYDDIEGGSFFIFIDEDGYSNYRLVHSSVKGEPKDYNWEARLNPAATAQDMIRQIDKTNTEQRTPH